MAKVAKSSGYQSDPASDLKDYLRGVKNVSELLTQTADRCKSEDIKQVCWIHLLAISGDLKQFY